ncbi:phosphatase PAP2 family protein [Nostocoides sp. HKS02]|uniref:phosphatase PAP2 family protein n=1 Tax=Nostocoides sp. HKS02 TaxID=1813880 RepID=UPI001E53B0B8|nr:phosphatase PAP2 family protein [Tetrasphaera sp. HKS02]
MPVRRLAGVLLACSAFLVVLLGVLFAHQTHADSVDRTLDAPVIAWFAGHPGLAARLASPGSLVPATVLTAALAVASLLAGRLNGALLALAVPVSVGLAEGLLKPLFDRTSLGSLAYPSGHATAMFAVASATAVLLLASEQPREAKGLRIALPAAMCLLGCTVSGAVIGLRWHYLTDTVAGAAVGLGTVCGLALLLDRPIVRSWLAGRTRA